MTVEEYTVERERVEEEVEAVVLCDECHETIGDLGSVDPVEFVINPTVDLESDLDDAFREYSEFLDRDASWAWKKRRKNISEPRRVVPVEALEAIFEKSHIDVNLEADKVGHLCESCAFSWGIGPDEVSDLKAVEREKEVSEPESPTTDELFGERLDMAGEIMSRTLTLFGVLLVVVVAGSMFGLPVGPVMTAIGYIVITYIIVAFVNITSI